jgi:VIT1/CCC1 family predicted Fe2+/Mn2+ transporter
MRRHHEHHSAGKVGWLRAAVLGANDGIVSTASLIVGVAAANAERGDILLAGFAGLVAGAMSMAAGEFVSVSTQRDSQRADLATERRELRDEPQAELDELTAIYVARGLTPELADEVAKQLTAKDALAAHARDELGLTEQAAARPLQAAFASAVSFAIGAALPLLAAAIAPTTQITLSVSLSALAFLALLGFLGAQAGGAKRWRATARVVFWGAAAMAITAWVGALFGAVV